MVSVYFKNLYTYCVSTFTQMPSVINSLRCTCVERTLGGVRRRLNCPKELLRFKPSDTRVRRHLYLINKTNTITRNM